MVRLALAAVMMLSAVSVADAATARKKCSDFKTYAAAQTYCEGERAKSPTCHGLDRNKDGSACECLPGGPKAGQDVCNMKKGKGKKHSAMSKPAPAAAAPAKQ